MPPPSSRSNPVTACALLDEVHVDRGDWLALSASRSAWRASWPKLPSGELCTCWLGEAGP
jgi:hypothetical protein